MKCPICNAPMVEEALDYVIEHEGRQVEMKDVPTWVCQQCDHTEVSEEVGEAVEEMLAHLDAVEVDPDEFDDIDGFEDDFEDDDEFEDEEDEDYDDDGDDEVYDDDDN